MTKKVIYKITKTTHEMIEVSTSEEESVVSELNRDTDRTEKSNARYQSRCSSYEELAPKGFSIVDDGLTPEEGYIENEAREDLQRRVRSAISKLTARQQKIVTMIFYEGKSQDDVALLYGISKQAVSNVMQRIYASLKKILEEK